jgi:PHP family Zn ribbon phosphoesterase
MRHQFETIREAVLEKTVCKLLGHKDGYSYNINKSDGKTYNITTCKRCWTEVMKEVK